jgi:hypothetical protein
MLDVDSDEYRKEAMKWRVDANTYLSIKEREQKVDD